MKITGTHLFHAVSIFLTIIFFASVLPVGTTPAEAQGWLHNIATAGTAVSPSEYNGDVNNLPPAPAPINDEPNITQPVGNKPIVPGNAPKTLQPHLVLGQMPTATTFAGMGFNDTCTGGYCGAGWPPDPNGDVGTNYYIEAVNDAFAIYNKTGSLLASFTENSLWSSSSVTTCSQHSYGDPVALYDRQADRWILTNFAFATDSNHNPISPFYECIAVSKTNNPVSGGWWLYPLRMDTGNFGQPPVGTMNDYPKFGVWTDCLYYAANGFSSSTGYFTGVAFGSLSRSDMYAGNSLTWAMGFISTPNDPFTMIPSNLSGGGANLPPSGTPNYFVSESQTAWAYEVRKFTAGTNCGGGGTLSSATNVSQATYTYGSGAIVPQPGITNTLDIIDDRLMQRVQYRKIGGAESLWVAHNIQTSSGGNAGMQWAQINVTGGTIATTPVQQQNFSPDTTLYRWMGSIAVDRLGNAALGYSTSNGSNYPSIKYAGRLVSDPLNQLPQGETPMYTGSGSQTSYDRWGDYSAMSVDPSDDCTFWYINEYYISTGLYWQTRIGSFKFPTCNSAPLTPRNYLPLIFR